MYIDIFIKEYPFRARLITNPDDKEVRNEQVLYAMDDSAEYSANTKDCVEPIDILFIDTIDGYDRINQIYPNCPVSKDNQDIIHYRGIGRFILKLPANTCHIYGIKEGDEVYFNETHHPDDKYLVSILFCSISLIAILCHFFAVKPI